MLSFPVLSGQTSVSAVAPIAAYVHIPFCRRRCFYCDFPIAVVGDRPPVSGHSEQPGYFGQTNQTEYGTIARYIDVLCQEILAPVHHDRPPDAPLETVFFGGGTPSLLTVAQLDRVLTTLDQQFGLAIGAEISMEIDPGTFDLVQVMGYRAAGVNRVSLGVQAFQPRLLQACGRSHTVEDVYTAVDQLHQAGFENISLDLISGLPHQNLEDWQDSLQRAIALAPTHLSCYDLIVEAGTPFSKQFKPGIAPLPDDDATAEMYRLASHTLRSAGYEHYEISNYAKPGYHCRHNRVYWKNRPFYGFGMGATSYLNGDRLARPRKTREYYAWVSEQIQAQTIPAKETPTVETPTGEIPTGETQPDSDRQIDRLLDTLMLGLRLAEGLEVAELVNQFGPAALEQVWRSLQPYYQRGWVVVDAGTNPQSETPLGDLPGAIASLPAGRIRLSDPEGFLFSNVILVSLFEAF